LQVQLPGRFSQDGIRSFYREKEITCFISLSTNEGLPVSMMEAMAFGIPVVSTDVGGCAEIVTPETGVLLPKNYTHEDVIKAVNTCAEKFASAEARKRIQDFIRQHFDAEKNYNKFLEFLDIENMKHIENYTK
jgi:glycosyltransferase involved in cell wall biosynthesis